VLYFGRLNIAKRLLFYALKEKTGKKQLASQRTFCSSFLLRVRYKGENRQETGTCSTYPYLPMINSRNAQPNKTQKAKLGRRILHQNTNYYLDEQKIKTQVSYLGGLFSKHSSTWESDGLIKDSLAARASSNGTSPVIALTTVTQC